MHLFHYTECCGWSLWFERSEAKEPRTCERKLDCTKEVELRKETSLVHLESSLRLPWRLKSQLCHTQLGFSFSFIRRKRTHTHTYTHTHIQMHVNTHTLTNTHTSFAQYAFMVSHVMVRLWLQISPHSLSLCSALLIRSIYLLFIKKKNRAGLQPCTCRVAVEIHSLLFLKRPSIIYAMQQQTECLNNSSSK